MPMAAPCRVMAVKLYPRGVAFDPVRRTLATGSYQGAVNLWDVASGRLLHAVAEGLRSSLGSP
jgi:hypothetical protein